MKWVLIQVQPYCNCAATAIAFDTSRVQIDEASPIFRLIGPGDRLLLFSKPGDRHDWAEDFTTHDLITLQSAGYQRRTIEEAVTVGRAAATLISIWDSSEARSTKLATRSRCLKISEDRYRFGCHRPHQTGWWKRLLSDQRQDGHRSSDRHRPDRRPCNPARHCNSRRS